jgi:hypothetical protein
MMDRRPLTKGEQVLVVLVVATLLPIMVVMVSFVIFGQGTPTLWN